VLHGIIAFGRFFMHAGEKLSGSVVTQIGIGGLTMYRLVANFL